MSKENQQEIKLVDGEFTPSQSSHIIMSLLNEKINYHKLERLSIKEGNVNYETDYHDSRILELERENEKLKVFLKESRGNKTNIRIDCTLCIKYL